MPDEEVDQGWATSENPSVLVSGFLRASILIHVLLDSFEEALESLRSPYRGVATCRALAKCSLPLEHMGEGRLEGSKENMKCAGWF